MRKHFILLTFIFSISFTALAQSGKSIRIGYIDMEYILQNVPEYAEANNQLEQKAQKWKQEMEVKKNEITKLEDAFKLERVLLTKELIVEREEAIAALQAELVEYQQKKFGPTGELIVQKSVLVKPIQDQIFAAVQDLAEVKKYDFIFDKSSDLTMLFAQKRFDISDQVIKKITASARRSQMTKKQIKEEEAKEYKENLEDANPGLAERQKKLEERKVAREKAIEDKKLAAEEKKNAADAKRQQLKDEKEAKKNGAVVPEKVVSKTVKENSAKTEEKSTAADAKANNTEVKKEANEKIIADREAAKKAVLEARTKSQAERQKAIEDRKAKVLADREAAKKAKDSIKNNK